jgi:tetratricopeptide (TPR) repeat protein
MRLVCWWKARQLAREVLLGAIPMGHAASCPSCLRERARLAALVGALPHELAVPPPSSSFEDRVWSRLATSVEAKRRRLRPLALCAVAVVGACAAWVVFRPTAAPPPEQVVRNHAAPDSAAVSIPSVIKTPDPQVAKAESNRSAKQVRTHHRVATRFAKANPKKQVATPQQVAAKKAGWTDWAAYYEQIGYYGEASDAYAQAYKERQDPSLAYAAGCTAENAGDIPQALTYYAELLDTTSTKDRS